MLLLLLPACVSVHDVRSPFFFVSNLRYLFTSFLSTVSYLLASHPPLLSPLANLWYLLCLLVCNYLFHFRGII